MRSESARRGHTTGSEGTYHCEQAQNRDDEFCRTPCLIHIIHVSEANVTHEARGMARPRAIPRRSRCDCSAQISRTETIL
jgi:hypothetical protein